MMRKCFLYKYFSNHKYAEDFLDGVVFFRSLAYFRDYEDNNVRNDKNEGASVYAPEGGLQINNLTQNNSGVAKGWSFVSTARQKDIFVFCLSQSFNEDLCSKFQAVVCVEIQDIGAFCARVEAALPANAKFPNPEGRARIGHRVTYYKATEAGNSRWALPEKIVTSKVDDYAWQNEFRLAFSVTNAFDFENVDTRLVHISHQEAVNPAEHQRYQAKAKHLRDISCLHSC